MFERRIGSRKPFRVSMPGQTLNDALLMHGETQKEEPSQPPASRILAYRKFIRAVLGRKTQKQQQS